MKTPQEEMLEKQMTRCAEAVDTCFDHAISTRRYDVSFCHDELRDAARLMGVSARLAETLMRLRKQGMQEDKKISENGGSNGQEDRQA